MREDIEAIIPVSCVLSNIYAFYAVMSISIYEKTVLGFASALIIALGLFPSQLLVFLQAQFP